MKKNSNKKILKILREKKLYEKESSAVVLFTDTQMSIIEKDKLTESLKGMSEEEILELLYSIGTQHDYYSHCKNTIENIGGFGFSGLNREEAIEFCDYRAKCSKNFWDTLKNEHLVELTPEGEYHIMKKLIEEGKIEWKNKIYF